MSDIQFITYEIAISYINHNETIAIILQPKIKIYDHVN